MAHMTSRASGPAQLPCRCSGPVFSCRLDPLHDREFAALLYIGGLFGLRCSMGAVLAKPYTLGGPF